MQGEEKKTKKDMSMDTAYSSSRMDIEIDIDIDIAYSILFYKCTLPHTIFIFIYPTDNTLQTIPYRQYPTENTRQTIPYR
jgi:hypothetical protein